MNFNEKVYLVVRRIPPGKVLTYGRVAQLLDVPNGARAVGWALHALAHRDHDVPWHRVINAQGRISTPDDEYDSARQRTLLEAEGITFDESGRVKLTGVGGLLWNVSPWEIRELLDAADER